MSDDSTNHSTEVPVTNSASAVTLSDGLQCVGGLFLIFVVLDFAVLLTASAVVAIILGLVAMVMLLTVGNAFRMSEESYRDDSDNMQSDDAHRKSKSKSETKNEEVKT